MKKPLLFVYALAALIIISCGHKYYTASNFSQETRNHRLVAVLPAEMIFTGTRPKNLTDADIAEIEENESRAFQISLYNSILKYANTRKYETTVNFQDVSTTLKLLENNGVSLRDSWHQNDKELAKLLGVDAIIRMRIQKQRYMSDLASYGVYMGQRIANTLGLFVPVTNKTNDINASCNLISNSKTLWNDHYTRASNWNSPANEVIEGITENFGKHFPYKRKRK